ncbi:DUF3037 domain-containing protein [Marinobacter sp. Hex_13]|uniref:DUF3037 domain-containing protein n=1 Tax=Marinobacter sp. Hex_13 TaxID=1795866 RepID=UPI00079248DC|nr:DUF3037 domain-containing protein [Marinobacter sp. Hex_13]KXJ42263.1 MAG: hypothetical protein AXW11_19310 [Marinobacter sp. Hex_13]
MERLACKYSVIQFLPYPETGEFANVGVLLVCEKTGLLDFRLETKRTSRYTSFFQNLDVGLYRFATKNLGEEMKRVRNLVAHGEQHNLLAAFDGLTHPRETILRFGTPRVVLTENPAAELDALFEHYVRHGFAKDANYEAELERKVKQCLQGLKLAAPFRNKKVGNDLYAVQFPLVQTLGNKATKAIKPFFLGQQTPNAIYDHADRWIAKLKRLEDMDLMPERVLFAVKGPQQTQVSDADDYRKRDFAFHEVRNELSSFAEIALDKDGNGIQAIRDFAVQ